MLFSADNTYQPLIGQPHFRSDGEKQQFRCFGFFEGVQQELTGVAPPTGVVVFRIVCQLIADRLPLLSALKIPLLINLEIRLI